MNFMQVKCFRGNNDAILDADYLFHFLKFSVDRNFLIKKGIVVGLFLKFLSEEQF